MGTDQLIGLRVCILTKTNVLLHRPSQDKDNNLWETETPKSHIHTESWNKKDRRHGNSRRKTTGHYTSATDKPLHFTSGKGSPSEQQPDTGVDHDHDTYPQDSPNLNKSRGELVHQVTLFFRREN